MKKLRTIIITFAAIFGLVAVPLVPTVASADDPADSIQQGVTSVGGDKKGADDLKDKIQTIVNVMLFILGAIAVIMIIIGGIRYTTSNGDAQQTKAAKDTILYAVVGLIVAILAYAIVTFIVSSFSGKS